MSDCADRIALMMLDAALEGRSASWSKDAEGEWAEGEAACPMCGWMAGTNPTSCMECARHG